MRRGHSAGAAGATLVLFLSCLGSAQAPSAPSALESLADRLESANADDERSAILRAPGGSPAELLTLCLERGNKRYADRNYPGALKSFRAALAVSSAISDQRGIGRSWEGIGRSDTQSRTEIAVAAFARALDASTAAADKAAMAEELRALSRLYRPMGRLMEAKETAERAIALYRELGNRLQSTSMLLTLSNAVNELGDIETATALLRQCLREAEEGGFTDVVMRALVNLGGVYFEQGDYERSLQYTQRSLQLNEQAPKPNRGLLVTLYVNAAVDFDRLGDDVRALEYFDKSIRLAQELGGQGAVNWARFNRGALYEQRGQPALALQDLRAAAAFYAKSSGRSNAVEVQAGLASALLANGDAAGAVEAAEQAASEARSIGAPKLIWETLSQVGTAYLRLGDRPRARAAFLEAISAVESMRARLSGGEDEKTNFFHDKVDPFHGMVRVLLEENQRFEALQYSERAKARLLLDVLKSGRAEITGAMTDSEKRRERELADTVVKSDSALARQRDPAKTGTLLLAWQKAAEQLDSWRSTLYAAHPALRLSRGELQPISLDEVSELLPDAHTVLLEYTVAHDAVYLFAITRAAGGKAQLTVHTLKSSAGLARQIEDFRRGLLSRDLGYRGKAALLYNRVLGPVAGLLRGKRLLVVVPDGPLWNLPFQALISPSGHHLIEDAAVFYVPSLTATREVLRLPRTSTRPRRTLLAFGGPAAGEGLPALPESVREARQLGQLYGSGDSAVFVEKQATKQRWKTEAPDYRVLHLAVHGVLNGNNPLYSYLALSPDSKSQEDGHLTAREILETSLHADLAVLSACETARGNFRFGEGLIGMSWAFLVAGSPAAMVSQWKVDSASTSQLMLAFHGNLRASGGAALSGRARALQRAEVRLLHSPEYSHPFYWAGFLLIGNGY